MSLIFSFMNKPSFKPKDNFKETGVHDLVKKKKEPKYKQHADIFLSA